MSFVAELKRRKVLRVAAVYASAVFAVIEGVDVLIASLGVPAGTLRLVTLLGIAGFPIALGLAWTFDVGRGGVRTTAGADTPEGRAELEAAAGLSLLDGRTMLLAGALVVFGLGLGTGIFLTPAPSPAVDDGPSIAVLPFENRSSDADAVFFVDGIHDEVLNQLSRIRALRVISRASVMAYRDDPKPIRQVGEELGVRTVVAGGVQRAGDAVRISVQLIDARNDAQIWAESYEQSLSPENLFAIQRDVSERISAALAAELTPAEADAIGAVPTESQEAYDLYLMGNGAYERDLAEAVDFYERALDVDPAFALAWAKLSETHSAMYQFHRDRTPARRELAREAMERALALDPDLPEAFRAQGYYHYWGFRDFDAALRAFERAEAGLPGDVAVMSGKAAILRRIGRIEEGFRGYERIVRVSPTATSPISNLALMFAYARNYDEARRLVDRTLALDPEAIQSQIGRGSHDLWQHGRTDSLRAELELMRPILSTWNLKEDDPNGIVAVEFWRVESYDRQHERAIHMLDSLDYEVLEYQTYYYPRELLRGFALRELGDEAGARAAFLRAREHLEEALAESPDEPRMLSALGRTLAALGETEAALSAALRSVDIMGPDDDSLDGPRMVWELAATHAELDQAGAAIDQLVRYYGGLGEWSVEALERHPWFERLADDPRWAEVEAASAAWDGRMEAAGLR